jgi:hypothetical protein
MAPEAAEISTGLTSQRYRDTFEDLDTNGVSTKTVAKHLEAFDTGCHTVAAKRLEGFDL